MRLRRSTRTGPLRAAVVLVLAAAFAAVSCGSGSDEVGIGNGPSGSSTRPTITIVTYSSYVLDEQVRIAVEERLDVSIEIRAAGDGAEALAGAILTAGRPEGDLFFGIDNTTVTRALASDLLEPVDRGDLPELSELAPTATPVPPSSDTGDANRVAVVPVSTGPVCIDYDRDWFASRQLAPPRSLDELTDPRYRDLLVVSSPVTSSPGLVFLAATYTALGDRAPKFWQELVGNGVAVSGSWDDAWNLQYTVNGGDRPLVLSYASSPPAEVFYSEGAVSEPRTGVIESTCAEQTEFAGVLRGTPDREAAIAVLDAMLSREWQESIPLANFVYPLRTDAALPELFERFAPRPSVTIVPEASEVAENLDLWIDEWRRIVER